MAQLIKPFNAQEYDPTQGVGGLPIGRHKVIIQSSEIKPNSKNDGSYLQLDLKIIDGPQAGVIGVYRLNLYHSNPQTVEFSHRQFSSICYCVNVFHVQDSAQLHNIPFMVEVGPQKNNPQYTEVKKVFDINGNEPGTAPQNQQNFGQQPGNTNQSTWSSDNGANQHNDSMAWEGQSQQSPQNNSNSANLQNTHAQQNDQSGIPPWAQK